MTTESSIAPIQSTRLQPCVVDGVGIRFFTLTTIRAKPQSYLPMMYFHE